ncbi:MAG: T9SS type A sorting domain-containing protein [Bacteroidales bacterium]
MKKFINSMGVFFGLWLLLGISQEPIFAQEKSLPSVGVDYKYVLMEKFTATWCTYCPASAIATRTLLEQGKKIAALSYQMVESAEMAYLYNTAGYQRGCYYDTIRAIPRTFFNGTHRTTGENEAKTLLTFTKIYDTCIGEKTPYTLDMKVRYLRDEEARRDSFVLDITIEKVAEHSGKDLYLQIAVTENNISKFWQGQTQVDHAERNMVPSYKGTLLDFSQGNTIKKTISFGMGAGYQFIRRNADIIAFIQDNSYTNLDGVAKQSRKVMQTDMWQMKTDTSALATNLSAAFLQTKPLILRGDSVQYFDNSLGNPTSRTWTFEGGTPASSTNLNPNVKYLDTGIFKTTLVIEKEGKKASYTWLNVVEVIDFTADFTSNYIKVAPGGSIQFSNTSLRADSASWTFGGGNPLVSTEQNPLVTYAQAGSYPVKLSIKYTDPTGRIFKASKTIFNYITVEEGFIDIEDTENTPSNLSIYPNPSKDGIFIVNNLTPAHRVRIFNMMGQEIKNCISKNCIDLSNTKRGMYFVKIEKAGEKQNTWINKIIW